MISRLFLDSSVADRDDGNEFASFSFYLRPSFDLRYTNNDFSAALGFLQIPLEDFYITDTVTVQKGEKRRGFPNRIYWEERVYTKDFAIRSIEQLITDLNEWLINTVDVQVTVDRIPIESQSEEETKEKFTRILPRHVFLRFSSNVCRTLGFNETVFNMDQATQSEEPANFERWLPGPLFLHLDAIEETGLHESGSETQFLSGGSNFLARRDSYLFLIDFHRMEWERMPQDLLSVAPEMLQWVRLGHHDIHRITVSLRHANGRLVKCRPKFYASCEILIKRGY